MPSEVEYNRARLPRAILGIPRPPTTDIYNMGPKRLLILGGTDYQVMAIRYAKRQGYYVITCDYVPDNPGHRLADEYHNVSTTDQPGVLALVERLRIDGILAYASDPAAPTAAYVAERLGLPGNPYDSVLVLTHKHLFRQFQHAH